MPDWFVETGIGESRFVAIEDGRIVDARIRLDDAQPAGSRVAARLVDRGRGGRNAVARDPQGREYLLPRAPSGVAEGATLTLELLREAIPGPESWKRPLARVADSSRAVADEPQARPVGAVPGGPDPLADWGWNQLVEEARDGTVAFEGGALRIAATPAMTLIDVDGWLDPGPLALAGARAAAAAIRRLDIGGSIGVDFPTLSGRDPRRAVADEIDRILPQPFERTAVNGFGFLQIVRPRRRASLIELAADRAGFETRALLRRAGRNSGRLVLVVPPAMAARLEARPDWLERLSAQAGGRAALRVEPGIAMHAAYVEKG